jgi:hypothetical protein
MLFLDVAVERPQRGSATLAASVGGWRRPAGAAGLQPMHDGRIPQAMRRRYWPVSAGAAHHEGSPAGYRAHQALVGEDVDGPLRTVPTASPVAPVSSLSDGNREVISPDRIRSRSRSASCRYGCSGAAWSISMTQIIASLGMARHGLTRAAAPAALAGAGAGVAADPFACPDQGRVFQVSSPSRMQAPMWPASTSASAYSCIRVCCAHPMTLTMSSSVCCLRPR